MGIPIVVPSAELLYSPAERASQTKMDARSVLRLLEEARADLATGDLFPSHRQWMKRLGASERSVRWALDELQRQGKIVRRQGAGTFVTDVAASNEYANGADHSNAQTSSVLVDAKTVVAITKPNRASFDYAMGLLFSRVEAKELSLICRIVTEDSRAQMPSPGSENPLGYILFHHDSAPLAQRLQAAGQRVVVIGSPLAGHAFKVPNVRNAQEAGGLMAVRLLLEQGHRNLAFYDAADLPKTQRYAGYQRALEEARARGERVESALLSVHDIDNWRAHPDAARRYFDRNDAPTAIVAWNDYSAVLLLNLLNYIGLRVPDDISLVGYDNLPQSALMKPAITTVDSGIEQQLEAALEILTAPRPLAPTHTTLVLPTLVRRESVAPPPA